MASRRPRGARSGRSSRRATSQVANQDGLAALGSQMRGGTTPGQVANEPGLTALGARVDQASGRGRGRRRRSGKERWSTRRKVVTALISLVVLALLAAGAAYGYGRYQFDKTAKASYSAEVPAQSGQPFTMLVIGSDSRVGENAADFGSASEVSGQRSDVVQLWRVTPSARQILIMSIPRDTVVAMQGSDVRQFGQYNRINSSFDAGANQLIQTITANFGIPINYTVQIDFAGFENAVNAVGGVYLDFNYPAKDAYSDLDITTTGCQLLDGSQALAVARARHYQYFADGYWQYDPTSDFGRIMRQDAFIRALIDRAKSTINPLKLFSFIGAVGNGVIIDSRFSYNQLLALALEYRGYNTGALVAQTLPTVSADAFGDLGDVQAVDQPAAQQMLVDVFGSSLVSPTSPPPDAEGNPEPPPDVTATTAAPATGGAAAPTSTPTTVPPPSYNPTPCNPG
jgi:LCP family protein required for cell wall assembly